MISVADKQICLFAFDVGDESNNAISSTNGINTDNMSCSALFM